MRPHIFAALALAFGLLAVSARAAEAPKPQHTTPAQHAAGQLPAKDQEIQALMVEKYGEHGRNIRVTVDGPTAILTGDVPNRATQELAEQIALSADGIQHVHNRLKIVGQTDERGKLNREAADARLEAQVKKRLKAEIGKRADDIEVEVVDDMVSLRGTIPDASRKQIALATAQKTEGIRHVIDLIKVHP